MTRTSVKAALLGGTLSTLCFAADALAQVNPPLISGALFPPGDATAGNRQPGAELVRYSLGGPDVVCNDGTTPVMYLRKSSNQDDKWLIYLEGGGGCNQAAECHDRWVSGGSQPNYGLQKMSTSIPEADWDAVHPASAPNGWTHQGGFYSAPRGIEGHGILSPDLANPFAGWNVVFAYYCSSDDWSGQATATTLANGAENYSIHFRGATIFDALIAQLQTGATAYQNERGDEFIMPDLDSAAMVLLAGSSGGANGVKYNLDRLRGLLPPSVKVRGVIDAAGTPTREFLPWNGPPPADSYIDYMKAAWKLLTDIWNHRGDASCLALNAAEPWRCADATHVLRHHITTPFFHRMDLQDKNTAGSFLLHYPPASYENEFAVRTSVQLHEIADLLGALAPLYPAEAATMANDPDWLPPGIYGPRCTSHVGLIHDETYSQKQVTHAKGALKHLFEALDAWVKIVPGAGTPSPEFVAVTGVGPLGTQQCP